MDQVYELPAAVEFISKNEAFLNLMVGAAYFLPLKKQIKSICEKDNREYFIKNLDEVVEKVTQENGIMSDKDLRNLLSMVLTDGEGLLWMIRHFEYKWIIPGVSKKVLAEYILSIRDDIEKHLNKKAS
jgi:hypothetical protein